MTRPTVHDVARVAGVSLATVDRVLNERQGVRPATVSKVQDAVREIGYARDLAAANLARQRDYTFAFVLPEATNSFLVGVHDAIRDAVPTAMADRVSIRILTPAALDPHAVARAVAELQDQGVDGIAIMSAETPQVRDSLIRAARAGIRTVAMISDLPSTARSHFIGIDGVAAGRVAGRLMGRFIGHRSGNILTVAGSMMVRDHLERRLGFDQVIGPDFPGLQTLASLEGRDDADVVYQVVTNAFRKSRNIVGVYCFGGGASGLLRALADLDIGREIVVIAHELTPPTRAALAEGRMDAVISQDVSHVVRSAIRVLRAECDGSEIVASQERIRIEITLKENLIYTGPTPKPELFHEL